MRRSPSSILHALHLGVLCSLLSLPQVGFAESADGEETGSASGEAESQNTESASQNGAAASTRYFSVWNYTQNAPLDEIAPETLGERELGYWKVGFDGSGGVVAASYHGATGAEWLSFRFVEADGRIFADLYGPTGNFIRRKGTPLSTRIPPPDVAGR